MNLSVQPMIYDVDCSIVHHVQNLDTNVHTFDDARKDMF